MRGPCENIFGIIKSYRSYEIETIYKSDFLLYPKLETARDLLILDCLTGLRCNSILYKFKIKNSNTFATTT